MAQGNQRQKSGVVLVVGGSGAIGSAIASHLHHSGRRVIVLDRQMPAQSAHPYYQIDIADEASVDAALAEVSKRFGAPDALICAAGYLSGGRIMTLDRSDIQSHLDVNLFGAFNVATRVARLMMERGGKILFLSSIHGQIGVPERGAYAMSKAALGALARAMAVELSPYGIRVNVLAPGAVSAGMGSNPNQRAYWENETAAGRVVEAEEVARFAEVLTSDNASFLSGQTIALDGGASNLRAMGTIFHNTKSHLTI